MGNCVTSSYLLGIKKTETLFSDEKARMNVLFFTPWTNWDTLMKLTHLERITLSALLRTNKLNNQTGFPSKSANFATKGCLLFL